MADPREVVAARIDNLEMKLAYQEEVIEALNKTVIEQWGKLDQALARIKRLEDRMGEVQVGAVRDASEETPPPHY
jgi:SlyX protein